MSLKLGALALALTLQSTCVSAGVKSLTPANFYQELDSRTWMIMFAVTGCTHCKQMKPMWDEMARQIAAADDDVFVGRVNSTLHNGIARTLRVKRFPTVLLIGPTGLVYEFTGRRGLPPLLDYARGGYRGTAAHMQLPEELEPAVSEYWLMAEALWPPLKQALTLSLGIVVGLKALVRALLWCLKRGAAPREAGAGAKAKEEKEDKAE